MSSNRYAAKFLSLEAIDGNAHPCLNTVLFYMGDPKVQDINICLR